MALNSDHIRTNDHLAHGSGALDYRFPDLGSVLVMVKKEKPLALIRRDNGDWSLHPPRNATIVLSSGPARMYEGKWDRPNEEDYRIAQRMWVHHQAR